MHLDIMIAGRCSRVGFQHQYLSELCREYVVISQEPDISFDIRLFDVEEEAKRNGILLPVPDSRAPYFESLAVYRKLAEAMLNYDTFLMHGVVISAAGSGIMFTAPSGTGKTTHAKLWLGEYADAHVVNGDKPLIHIGEEAIAYGTPWCGKENMGCNESIPLKAICIIERSEQNEVIRVRIPEIWPVLLHQVYMPQEPEKIQQTLQLFSRLCKQVKIYRVRCNMDSEAAHTVRAALENDGIIPERPC